MQSARKVHYADKRELETAIITRYPPDVHDPVDTKNVYNKTAISMRNMPRTK